MVDNSGRSTPDCVLLGSLPPSLRDACQQRLASQGAWHGSIHDRSSHGQNFLPRTTIIVVIAQKHIFTSRVVIHDTRRSAPSETLLPGDAKGYISPRAVDHGVSITVAFPAFQRLRSIVGYQQSHRCQFVQGIPRPSPAVASTVEDWLRCAR